MCSICTTFNLNLGLIDIIRNNTQKRIIEEYKKLNYENPPIISDRLILIILDEYNNIKGG